MRRSIEWIARTPGRAFVCIFALAFAVRALPLASGMVPPAWLVPEGRGTNATAVALTLAATGRYADPYLVPSGPTAHPLPLGTALMAATFKLFGVTPAAGYARCLLHIASRAAMLGLLPLLAARHGLGAPAGVLGGVAGALVLQAGVYEILGWSLNEPFAAIALGWLLVAQVRRWTEARASAAGSLLLGAGWGVAFHLAPALVVVLLGCVAFELWWRRGARTALLSLAVAAGVVLACVPWAWRNWNDLHAVFFVRSNLGLELRIANHEGALADLEAMDSRDRHALRHPETELAEAHQVAALGEAEYMRRQRDEALAWIAAHPGRFVVLTLERWACFFLGSPRLPLQAAWLTSLTMLALVGFRRLFPGMTTPQRAAVLVPLLTFPAAHAVFAYMFRYTEPLNWLLLLLAGAAVWGWIAPAVSATGPVSGRATP